MSNRPPRRSTGESIAEDIGLLIGDNKGLVVIAVLLIIFARPAFDQWKSYKLRTDQAALCSDTAIIVVRGEAPAGSNTPYSVLKKEGCFGGDYLNITATGLPEDGYLSLTYRFPVTQSGSYKIFVAGSPPGATKAEDFDKTFSAYEVIIDGKQEIAVDEQSKKETLIRATGDSFYSWYEYAPGGFRITKIGEVELETGSYEIEFRISKPRISDGKLAFFVDTIFVIPKGWKSGRRFFSLPQNIFLD